MKIKTATLGYREQMLKQTTEAEVTFGMGRAVGGLWWAQMGIPTQTGCGAVRALRALFAPEPFKNGAAETAFLLI